MIPHSTKQAIVALSKGKAELLKQLMERNSSELHLRRYPRERRGDRVRLPTSWAQERLWFISHLEGASAAYHIQIPLRLKGHLDRNALSHALNAVVRRHEILRTVFVSEDGDPRQEILDSGAFNLKFFDLSNTPSGDIEEYVRHHKDEEAHALFDLHTGPLIRGRLLRLQPNQHVLLITMHHIISDGWSIGVFIHEVEALYRAHNEEQDTSPLEPLPIQYADYAQWQREWIQKDLFDKQLRYWKTHLTGAPPQLDLPTDRPRPAINTYRGRDISITLDATLTAELKAFSKQHGVTLFMVLYAGLALLLARLSGQEDISIGTPVANRQHPELEQLIGFFVNTVVLRVHANGEIPIEEFLDRVKEITLSAYDHQDIPFEAVVSATQPERNLSVNPLFQVMFALQNVPKADLQLPHLRASIEEGVHEFSQFDLLLAMEERADQIAGILIYAADLFDQSTVERWMASYQVVLKRMMDQVSRPVKGLSILAETERHQTLRVFNETTAKHPTENRVHELFEAIAEDAPDALAVSYGQQNLTYAELRQRSNQLAAYLRAQPAGGNNLVGIYIDRSLEMVIGLLGILKAGYAYVPLDPNYPAERLHHMLNDANPHIIVTREPFLATLPATTATTIVLDRDWQDISSHSQETPSTADLGVPADMPVYVIYTSGSTGIPKGVTMGHAAMTNLIEWHRAIFPVTVGRRVAQYAALSFDVAFQEIFTTLCTGGTLELLDEWIRRDPQALTEFLKNKHVERLFMPPLMLQSLAEYSSTTGSPPGALQDIIVAGEQLRITPQISALFGRLRGCLLHNHYGPTETHVVTALTLPPNDYNWPLFPPIGRPVSNTHLYVLDGELQPAPIGVTGDIYIGGAAVAQGYLLRPQLTAQRFTADPYSTGRWTRIYKTGDRGRWRSDGHLEYLGRNDNQVKIRGYRVELGEIEALLARHPDLQDVVVLARELAHGDKRLVAFFTARRQPAPSIEHLRAHLRAGLPEYMIPSQFVELKAMPLTPSGKLDRGALPVIEPRPNLTKIHPQPAQGELERSIASVWSEVLQVEYIGREDNFFETGGNSMLVIKALFKINQALGSDLRVLDAYVNPTIRGLAIRIRSGRSAEERIDLSKEATLRDLPLPQPGRPYVPAKNILLTGATGFVGRFLLAQLLIDTDATVYCLVRATSASHAAARIQKTLVEWDLWRPHFEERIIGIPGDLREPHLGIEDDNYQALCIKIDSIYNCGTSMNHLESYEMAKPANVNGVIELLRLSTQGRPKLLNQVSTLGVFTSNGKTGVRTVNEQSSIDQETHLASHGYLASKWVAEKLVTMAVARGLQCNIFRLGLVWADTQQGRYDDLQSAHRIVKSCVLSGLGIKDFQYTMPPTPIDYVARAMVFLANRCGDRHGVYHITSSNQMSQGLFERFNELSSIALPLFPFPEWIREIKRLHQEGVTLPIAPLIESIESAFSSHAGPVGAMHDEMAKSSVQVECNRTLQDLVAAGIEMPDLSDDVLKLYLATLGSRDSHQRLS